MIINNIISVLDRNLLDLWNSKAHWLPFIQLAHVIVKAIRDQEVDYLLASKSNQYYLRSEVALFFDIGRGWNKPLRTTQVMDALKNAPR